MMAPVLPITVYLKPFGSASRVWPVFVLSVGKRGPNPAADKERAEEFAERSAVRFTRPLKASAALALPAVKRKLLLSNFDKVNSAAKLKRVEPTVLERLEETSQALMDACNLPVDHHCPRANTANRWVSK